MTIKNLSHASFDELVDCFLLAFENYYVKMPTDKAYYRKRWKAAKVNFELSYGMFDKNQLVGFIIHAVDTRGGKLIAFNTGTGVIPAYRGKRIVKAIYDYALRDLRDNGIQNSALEVITKNDKAIRAYKSVGFDICKEYRCYAGELEPIQTADFELKTFPIASFDWEKLPNQGFYSWDFQKETILNADYQLYQVFYKNEPESYFIIRPENRYLAQFDIFNKNKESWNRLFEAIRQVSSKVRIINVDTRLTDKLDMIETVGLKNTVNQYEMKLLF